MADRIARESEQHFGRFPALFNCSNMGVVDVVCPPLHASPLRVMHR